MIDTSHETPPIMESKKAEKNAVILDVKNPEHIQQAVDILHSQDGIIALPFNGIFGLAGNYHNPRAADHIFAAKDRPPNQTLITIIAPENLGEIADLDKVPYSPEQIQNLLVDIHALGIIFPARDNVPDYLRGQDGTVLNIWTEYAPLRALLTQFRTAGGTALVGTSANKHGHPTHSHLDSLVRDFKNDVDAILHELPNFEHLPEERRKSTSIIDLTTDKPKLHRLGNVSVDELQEKLQKHGFPELELPASFIIVKTKEDSPNPVKNY